MGQQHGLLLTVVAVGGLDIRGTGAGRCSGVGILRSVGIGWYGGGAAGTITVAVIGMMSASRGTGGCLDRLAVGAPGSDRRMGDGRAGRSRRCAFPTIAFFETSMRRPISAAECPSAHSTLSR
jgi:hypothetical protein